jgi:GAF domain-containing protein
MSMNDVARREALAGIRQLSSPPETQRHYLDLALAIVCRAMAVPLGKVLELNREGTLFLVRAGIGWREGVTGHATVPANLKSIAGYTLGHTGVVIIDDVKETSRFTDAQLLRSHDVRSSLAARVSSIGRLWGVLTVHEQRRRRFSPSEIQFLKDVVAELGKVIETREATQNA